MTAEPRRFEPPLFTFFVGLIIAAALWIASDWPLRASIVIVLLGGAGLALAAAQLAIEIRGAVSGKPLPLRPRFELAPAVPAGGWGTLEIWAWIWGLFFAIHLVGFPLALPLFAFFYVKIYGGGWPLAAALAIGIWGFIYGVFEALLHVPWPRPLLAAVLGG
jgi:hypothetical protein